MTRAVKIPKVHETLYDRAVIEQRKLLNQGFNRPLFDIMLDLLEPPKAPKKPPGWVI